jgi:hypothetical protein
VPKVGQWGRLRFEGGLLQQSFTSETSLNYPKPQATTIQRNSKCYNRLHQLQTRYKDIQIRYTDIQDRYKDTPM